MFFYDPVVLEHRRQIPDFGFHFDGVGHGIGDFLTKKVSVPLAEPVNRHLERPF